MFVICTHAVQGGAWKRLVEALRHLASEYECHLITYSNPDLHELREFEGLTVHEIKVPHNERSTFRFARSTYAVLCDIEFPDDKTVWCGSFSGNSGLALSFYKLMTNRSFSIFSFRRGANLKRLKMRLGRDGSSVVHQFIGSAFHKFLTHVQLNFSDLLITQTGVGLRELQDDYPDSIPSRVAVLPNNVNTKWIERQRRNAEHSTFQFEDERFLVCFVGRIELKKKGVDTLLESIALLRDEPIAFDLVGSGPDLKEVKRFVNEHSLDDSVRLHGWMANPLSVMKQADLVVVPSRSDPLPNVVLEAFAMDKPVIGSNVDGIPIMLNHPSLLFEPGDGKQLASLIRQVQSDENYYEKIKRICCHRASHYHFDWGERFEEIFADGQYHTNAIGHGGN